jgi:pentatricopeptide repeat protein
LIDAQVVFKEMQQSATSVGVPQDAFNMVYNKTGSSEQVARAIFVDPEHRLYPQLFHPEQLISGKEDTTNNFSHGYCTIGKGMVLVANNFGDDLARRSEIKQPWPPPHQLACLDLNIMVVSVFLATSYLHAVTYIYALSRKGQVQEPDRLFKVAEKNGTEMGVFMYNTLINHHCIDGNMERAYEIMVEMEKKRIAPDNVAYNTLMRSFACLGNLMKLTHSLMR